MSHEDPKCPECDREINSLDYEESRSTTSSVSVVGGRLMHENDREQEFSSTYSCPKCSMELFWDESEAIDFLKNREEPAERR